MKKLVFVMSDFMPKNTANSILVWNLINELKRNFDISVICLYTKDNLLEHENIDGINVYRVHNNEYDLKYSINQFKNIKKLTKYMFKIKNTLKFYIEPMSIRKNLVRNYLDKLHELKISSAIIIPVCFPIESAVAVNEYSKIDNGNIIIPYFIDNFSNSNTLHRTYFNKIIKFKNNLKMEKEIIANSYHVITTNDWEEHVKIYFKSFRDKISVLFLPCYLPKNDSDMLSASKLEDHDIIYAGTFIKKIRSPKYLLKVMCDVLNDETKMNFNIYGRSSYDSYIKNIASKNQYIFFNGYVDYEKIRKIINSSKVLVSVGNKKSTQTPSKIYEYVSTGKFIIHFYYSSDDPAISILKRYGNFLLIKIQNRYVESVVNEIRNTLLNDLNMQINQEDIYNIFYKETPEYFSSYFLQILNNRNKEKTR